MTDARRVTCVCGLEFFSKSQAEIHIANANAGWRRSGAEGEHRVAGWGAPQPQIYGGTVTYQYRQPLRSAAAESKFANWREAKPDVGKPYQAPSSLAL